MVNVGDQKTSVIMTVMELLITVGLELERILQTLFTNLWIREKLKCSEI